MDTKQDNFSFLLIIIPMRILLTVTLLLMAKVKMMSQNMIISKEKETRMFEIKYKMKHNNI